MGSSSSNRRDSRSSSSSSSSSGRSSTSTSRHDLGPGRCASGDSHRENGCRSRTPKQAQRMLGEAVHQEAMMQGESSRGSETGA